jgi:sulfate permease, SulP family
MVAWNMSEAKHFIALLKDSKINYLIMLTTFFITIFVGVSESISVGLLLSFAAKKWLEPAKS